MYLDAINLTTWENKSVVYKISYLPANLARGSITINNRRVIVNHGYNNYNRWPIISL